MQAHRSQISMNRGGMKKIVLIMDIGNLDRGPDRMCDAFSTLEAWFVETQSLLICICRKSVLCFVAVMQNQLTKRMWHMHLLVIIGIR